MNRFRDFNHRMKRGTRLALWSVGQGVLILLALLANSFFETLLQKPEYVEIYIIVLLIMVLTLLVIVKYRNELARHARRLTLNIAAWLIGIMGTVLLAGTSTLFFLIGVYNLASYVVFGLFFTVVVQFIYLIRLAGESTRDPSKDGATVHVDAKIIGKNDPSYQKRTLVGYIVKDSASLQSVTEVDADETDEAELESIAFAIRELKGKLPRFTIVCDHESVVSEINRGVARPRSPPALSQIQMEMRANLPIKVVQLAKNPAHALLNRAVAALKTGGQAETG